MRGATEQHEADDEAGFCAGQGGGGGSGAGGHLACQNTEMVQCDERLVSELWIFGKTRDRR